MLFRSSNSVIDRCLSIHRSTRMRCLAELKELGFIKGTDSGIIICDPIPILEKLKNRRRQTESQVNEILAFNSTDTISQHELTGFKAAACRDYLQEATDAWNKYRPKDYRKIRRISSQLVKAIDIHMRELGVKPHHYDEFFSVLKSGIDRSEFWSNTNSNKTLQSITGIGTPTDKKKTNVYTLFNDGIDTPSNAVEEEERNDTIVYPAEYRNIIDEYDAAQTAYSQAYWNRSLTDDHSDYLVRTENALKRIGLDPLQFKFKFGIRNWPTDTPEPEVSRVINWTYDDEYSNAF